MLLQKSLVKDNLSASALLPFLIPIPTTGQYADYFPFLLQNFFIVERIFQQLNSLTSVRGR